MAVLEKGLEPRKLLLNPGWKSLWATLETCETGFDYWEFPLLRLILFSLLVHLLFLIIDFLLFLLWLLPPTDLDCSETFSSSCRSLIAPSYENGKFSMDWGLNVGRYCCWGFGCVKITDLAAGVISCSSLFYENLLGVYGKGPEMCARVVMVGFSILIFY